MPPGEPDGEAFTSDPDPTLEVYRSAIDRVLADVRHELGADPVVVIDSEDPDRHLEELSHDAWLLSEVTAPNRWPTIFVGMPDEGWTGIGRSERPLVDEATVAIADVVQEVLMESRDRWAVAFPACPAHPGTPLWPRLRDGTAVWTCTDGAAVAVPIGSLGGTERAS